jgi:hypothetical protein
MAGGMAFTRVLQSELVYTLTFFKSPGKLAILLNANSQSDSVRQWPSIWDPRLKPETYALADEIRVAARAVVNEVRMMRVLN